MARRLPIYLLMDTSGSMSGEPLVAAQSGIQMLVSSLRQDPQALETAYLSVITFDSTARQAVPLTELSAFQEPHLVAQGVTALGDALRLVTDCADREIRKSTPEMKGDWKPLVFIFTDGIPTDDLQSGLTAFKRGKWGIVVVCGVIDGSDVNTLKQISETVVMLKDANPATLAAFFKWVSSSIAKASASVANNVDLSKGDQLPPPPPEIVVAV
ncbi:MAG: VWA domain-containing protein [Actinobacteria bacterium]|nr:VWA domain-containing protein [Actinomycetota bacterium]